jgi:shikimate kinase
LGWPFVDTDQRIETDYGSPIAEIFANKGEAFFRDLETQVLEKLALELAQNPSRCVISTGGGAIISEHNRLILRSLGKVIFLTAPAKVLAARLSGDTARPLLQTDNNPLNKAPESEQLSRLIIKLENLFNARQAAYLEADLIVETGELEANDVGRRICQSLCIAK